MANSDQLDLGYKFQSVTHVIAYLNYNNPARARRSDPMERETRSSSEDTSAEWALILQRTHKLLLTRRPRARAAFELRYFGPDRDRLWHIDDIAKRLHVSPSSIRRDIHSVLDDLERLYIALGLIEPPDDYKWMPST